MSPSKLSNHASFHYVSFFPSLYYPHEIRMNLYKIRDMCASDRPIIGCTYKIQGSIGELKNSI